MQICGHCNTRDNPDTARRCYACGKSPLRPYRKRYPNLQAADIASLSPAMLQKSSDSLLTVFLLSGIILILLGVTVLPFKFAIASADTHSSGVHASASPPSRPSETTQYGGIKQTPPKPPGRKPSKKPPQLCEVRDVDLGYVQQGTNITNTLFLKNCGEQSLTWQLQSNSPTWLNLSRSSGTIAPEKVDPVTFTATSTDQGYYAATVLINWNGGKLSAKISMTVVPQVQAPPPPQPHLVVTPNEFSVQDSAVCQPVLTLISSENKCLVKLQNTGNGTENWTTDATASSQSGSIPAGGVEDIAIFLPLYCDNTTIITFKGLQNSATVSISGCQAPPAPKPFLVTDPTTIDVQTCPPDEDSTWNCQFDLENTGDGADSWNTVSGETDPASGNLAANDTATIQFSVDRYCKSGTAVEITGLANDVSVTITDCPPRLFANPTTMDVQQACSSNNDDDSEIAEAAIDDWHCSFELTNTGDTPDSWKTVSGDTDPTSGNLAVGPAIAVSFFVAFYCENGTVVEITGLANSVSVQITDCPVQPPPEALPPHIAAFWRRMM